LSISKLTGRIQGKPTLESIYSSIVKQNEIGVVYTSLKEAIRLSCELNLYYRHADFISVKPLREPLAYFIIDTFKPLFKKEQPNYESDLKKYADVILEKYFYSIT